MKTNVITSDDSSVVREFENEFYKRWDSRPIAIYNFDDLIKDGNVAFPNGFVMKDFLKSSKEQIQDHITYHILQLMVMAKSDQCMCTYSSNVCRVILLLRDSSMPYESVHSFDWPHWVSE